MTRARAIWINAGVPVDTYKREAYAESNLRRRTFGTKRVLVACERSGRVRDWLRLTGIEAWSCDIHRSDIGGPHLRGDVLNYLYDGWDAMVAHPPCTYLTRANVHGRRAYPDREQRAIDFVQTLWQSPIAAVIVENPIGALWRVLGRPNQIVQPWHFGDPYTKATCLWMRGVRPLRLDMGLFVRASGQWTDAKRTSKQRSTTFHGIAGAIARAVARELSTA